MHGLQPATPQHVFFFVWTAKKISLNQRVIGFFLVPPSEFKSCCKHRMLVYFPPPEAIPSRSAKSAPDPEYAARDAAARLLFNGGDQHPPENVFF